MKMSDGYEADARRQLVLAAEMDAEAAYWAGISPTDPGIEECRKEAERHRRRADRFFAKARAYREEGN